MTNKENQNKYEPKIRIITGYCGYIGICGKTICQPTICDNYTTKPELSFKDQ